MATTELLLAEVPLPHLASMESATLTLWSKQVGEAIAEGETICEVTTEKVDTEIESPVSGIIAAHLFEPGVEIPLGTVVALVAPTGTDAADIAAAVAAHSGGPIAAPATPSVTDEPAPPPETVRPANGKSERILASPLAKRLAREHGVDLTQVVGTGTRGKITRDDVLATARGGTVPDSRPPASPAIAVPQSPAPAQPVAAEPAGAGSGIPSGFEDLPVQAIAHSSARRGTAKNLTRSWQTMPQLTHEIQVDLSRVEAHRQELNATRAAQGLGKVSVLSFIVRATCQGLIAHPQLNGTFTEDSVLRWGKVKLGIAVDTPQGLMVPGIVDAQNLTLPALADAIGGLAARARNRELTAGDMRGVTFTISNAGPLGAWRSPAVVPPTNVAIMGVPTVVRTPVAVSLPDGSEVVAIRPIINLAVTYDHRALDGSDVGAFLKDVKAFLEGKPLDAYL
jgi:2-oxoglutarate dehydrogenase E2 component (dihydrolipoamide succinyltransferase)